MVSLLAMSLGNFGQIIDHYPTFLICYSFCVFGWIGLLHVSYLYLLEITGVDKRVFQDVPWFTYNSLIGLTFYLPRIIGKFLMAALYERYDITQISLWEAIISLLAILLLGFLPESPKWLLSQFRVKEAQEVLNDMSNVNGTKMNLELDIMDSTRKQTGNVINKDIKVKFNCMEGKVSLEQTKYSFLALFDLNLIRVGVSQTRVLLYVIIIAVHRRLHLHLLSLPR